MRRRLPTGIQTFREIRGDGHYYVDKTVHIERLIDVGKHYFLSRPRRFGKSLLVDTIKDLFEGREELFRGLYIHDRWDWSARHPVVRLDFGGGDFRTSGGLNDNLRLQFDSLERDLPLRFRYDFAPGRFRHLIETLHEHTGERVVVLVDEYDKAVLDPLVAGDRELARTNRDALRGLYGNIKSCDAHIRFSFVTGVSKFTKVSLFSELNNLDDITIDPQHATICGYTDHDIDTIFAPELEGLDRDAIRDWYNGYHWRGKESVYNPFDILLLFRKREFAPYWFETGSPAFLIETLKERGVFTMNLEGMVSTEDLLSAFDVNHIGTEALLFQTGYLTIAESFVHRGRLSYRLGYPNLEVRESLNRSLLQAVGWDEARSPAAADRLYDALAAADLPGLEAHLRSLFAGIPYNWHVNNPIANYEGYYASVVYAHFAALGVPLTVEEAGASGRLDLAVRVAGRVYLFEFKVRERAGEGAALAQLQERGYADKHRAGREPVHLVGVEFSPEARSLTAFETAMA